MTSCNPDETTPLFELAETPAEPTGSEAIQIVFDHWVATCRGSNKGGVKPVLTDKRAKVISRAIGWYGIGTCKAAIDGIVTSDFHMGRNRSKKRYDSIELILRDAEHIEGFAEMASIPDAAEVFHAEA
jgi:hypothetical protein